MSKKKMNGRVKDAVLKALNEGQTKEQLSKTYKMSIKTINRMLRDIRNTVPKTQNTVPRASNTVPKTQNTVPNTVPGQSSVKHYTSADIVDNICKLAKTKDYVAAFDKMKSKVGRIVLSDNTDVLF